jgi:hypothetical protein
MEPLICPQCGGQITDYSPGQAFAFCGYCGTRFLIENQKPHTPAYTYDPQPEPPPRQLPQISPQAIAGIVTVGTFALLLIAVFSGLSKHDERSPTSGAYNVNKTSPTPKPTPATDPNLLTFGGKGTGNGLFQDANSIAVDKVGRIYVSDDSLRVQQFDNKGQYLKTIQVPSKGANYNKARTIDKIGVDSDNKLYVAVGGVVLIYGEQSTEPIRTLQVAPDYIQDFALRSDGGVLMISDNDEIETLLFANKAGKITKRIEGFHTDAADAAVSPKETALAAIRLAVDGAGNIFSVYAFGDLGNYSLDYNREDLVILRFSPEGKFVNKFAQSMQSCGIAVDNQSRIYVSNGAGIETYSKNGEALSGIDGLGDIRAFALDKDNNTYFLQKDTVIKRAAIH